MVEMLINYGNSENGCLGCQTTCDTCEKMIKEIPDIQPCVCFVCPDCKFRNHELMMHTCGKEISETENIISRNIIIATGLIIFFLFMIHI